MDEDNIMMYQSNIDDELTITAESISPVIQYCNYIEVLDNEYWGWRIIPDYELILIVEGEFLYKTRENSCRAGRGDVICIPPLLDHYLCHIGEMGAGVISCIHSEPTRISQDETARHLYLPGRAVTNISPQYEFFHSLFSMAADNFGYPDEHTAELLTSIVKTIWLAMMKYWQEPYSNRLISETSKEMSRWIRDNIKSKISRRDIAEHFCYSPEYVNYLFKKELGVTTSQFINREKVLCGFRMIHQGGMSVKEAAAELGFNDQYHFSKVFKKLTGRNPSGYKR
jgi:AraC-like DNA-binding protein